MYTYVHACAYVYINTHTHTHTRTHAHTHINRALFLHALQLTPQSIFDKLPLCFQRPEKKILKSQSPSTFTI